MRNRWSLRRDNRGASLIAVVVIMIVVSVIGVAITELTISNIQMKEVERAGKTQFYSTEELTDEISVGLNDLAAKAMRDAYVTILSDYRNIMVHGESVQTKFMELYMDNLRDTFQGDPTVQNLFRADGTVSYEIGSYDTDLVMNCLKAENQYAWQTPTDPKYHVDYEDGVFVLKNLCIKDTDANSYETIIHTDVVFHTPELNFKGSNTVKGFMRYALIADRQIYVGSPSITVNGNAYAGYDGILCDHGSAAFNGNTTVTRGSITANPGANLSVGTSASKVWAENVETAGSGDPSQLYLHGNCYIADDLTLNGRSDAGTCTVAIDGNYYGYNFQDNYTEVRTNTDASYSSAIMINAKDSKLDLTNTDYLLLSGRTYIARGSGLTNQDVPLGESLSVRSNQMAYYVPESFLDLSQSPVAFVTGGERALSNYLGVPDVETYLNSARPVTGYHYVEGARDRVAYYLNFESEQKANDFFSVYATANNAMVNTYGSAYAANDALILSDTTIYSLRGDLMYRDTSEEGDPLKERRIYITGGWNEGKLYWKYANSLAMTYKALQLKLEEQDDSVTAANVRFVSGGVVDKSIDPLTDQIIDKAALAAKVASSDPLVDASDTSKVAVVASGSYDVPSSYSGGIIIAMGDVTLNSNFKGMIISGGTIRFAVGGVTVQADEVMVSQMFTADSARPNPVFADLFVDFNHFSDSVIGQVEIERYLTYDNWTKTEE